MKFNPFTQQLDFDTVTPIDTDGTMAANSDLVVPSQKAVVTYVGSSLASIASLKGAIDASGNPNYPAASAGDFYYISVAGRIGGGSGPLVSVGDALIAKSNTAAGTQAAVGANWLILEANIPGITSVGNALATLTNPSAVTFIRINADNSVTARSASELRQDLGFTTVGTSFATLTNPSAVTFPRINADNSVTARSASDYRGDIGGSTVGSNLFTLANPSAVTFLRINADNTATTRSASDFRGDIGGTTVGANVFTLTNPSAISYLKINADNTVTTRSDSEFRGDLGATTVGANLFTLTNPSAVTFLRLNADNTASTRSASDFRVDIGGSTIGSNIFTLTNPSAVTFLRMNADNTASARSASDFRGDIGATTVGANLFTLANPSAVRFIKINADNTVTARSATDFKSDLALPAEVGFAVSDETTAITTGTSKITLFIPYSMTLTSVLATLSTASTSGTPTIDINFNSNSIFSTLLTIDANELTSFTAATPAVLSNTTYTAGDTITVDIDVAGTGAKGLKIWLIGTRA